MIICEGSHRVSTNNVHYILWRGFSKESNVTSVLSYVEENGIRLRLIFLKWVYDLGELKIRKKSLIDQLTIADELSHWWLTRLAEKSVYKTDINTALKIIALEEILNSLDPLTVCVNSNEKLLINSISDLCFNKGWEYKKNHQRRWVNLYISDVFLLHLNLFRGALYLTWYCLTRMSARGNVQKTIHKYSNQIFICSYLTVDSSYWKGLDQCIKSTGKNISWLQLFYKHVHVPNFSIARRLISLLNSNSKEGDSHCLLDANVSVKIVLNVIYRWAKLYCKSLTLTDVRLHFQPADCKISMWPLLRQDWYGSLVGQDSIKSLFSQILFDQAFAEKPYHGKGFYLCENQAWEIAMLHAWRKHCHGEIIGVAHSTVRFWDVRYFEDLRLYGNRSKNNKPMPNFLVVNGNAAYQMMLTAGFPNHLIYTCEALRYNYLNKQISQKKLSAKKPYKDRILLLGDYMVRSTQLVFNVLIESGMGSEYDITFKPHPDQSFNNRDNRGLKINVTNEPLSKLLEIHDLVLAPHSTSATVDAYCCGLKVIILLDFDFINFSPLRNWSDVEFINNGSDLRDALLRSKDTSGNIRDRDYFCLEPSLPRWKALLDY